jgi:hypothetical protein
LKNSAFGKSYLEAKARPPHLVANVKFAVGATKKAMLKQVKITPSANLTEQPKHGRRAMKETQEMSQPRQKILLQPLSGAKIVHNEMP